MDPMAVFENERDACVADWERLLAFPSISAEPAHAGDCRACAQWLVALLNGMGFDAGLRETAGHPAVWGEWRGRTPQSRAVLFYGHYDVQPPDPLDQWLSPPFTPTWRAGRLYARGAQDNKGQVMAALKGLHAALRAGVFQGTLKVLIEGEEENSSAGLTAALPAWCDALRADVLMVCDTDMIDPTTPALVMGLRGIAMLTATLHGPAYDLHSGLHGGVAPNPAAGLARLVAGLHHADGTPAVKGFLNAVRPPTPRERALAHAVPFDPAHYAQITGAPPAGGEPGFSPTERLGFRPTIEINGLHGGYGGPGSKTIIPAGAMAKITARLVPDQDPAAILDCLEAHLRAHTPPGLRLEITEAHAAGPGFRLDPDAPAARQAHRVLAELCGGRVAYLWEGASIPVVAALARAAGAEPLLAGFGTAADRIHAPNESYSLDQFRLGYRYAAGLLARLGQPS